MSIMAIKDGKKYPFGVIPSDYAKIKSIINSIYLNSESNITVRTVFGNNNSSGVCASSMIPLLLADSCNITISDMTVVGTSTHIDLTKIIVSNKTKYGFAVTCGDYENVQNKSVTITYSYTRTT